MKVKRVVKFNIKKSHIDYQYIKIKLIKSKEIRNRFEGIQIDNSELEITFEELERLINEFFAKYGNS